MSSTNMPAFSSGHDAIMHETEYNVRAEVANSAIFPRDYFCAHDTRFVIFVV